MAEALVLDSEALNALARPKERGVLFERTRAILSIACERRALVRVPSPVLAEVCRGPRFDAAIEHVLKGNGIRVVELTEAHAKIAGQLLAKARMNSANAVDAFVVATALSFPISIIATGDPDDIKRLSAGHSNVRVYRT
jgi:predicted nucleic acid-binding protein